MKRLRLLRGWCLLLMLAEPGPPSTAAELLERLRTRYPFDGLELSLQTTRDDLRLLAECGLPVVPLDRDGNEIDVCEFDRLTGRLKNVRWTLRDPARLGELHPEGLPRPGGADVLALNLLRSALGQCAPAGFWLAPTVRRLLDEVSRLQTPFTASAKPRGTVRVRLRVRASAAPALASALPPLRRVQGADVDGWARVEFQAPCAEDVEAVALTFAETAVVEEPAAIRGRVRARLQAACKNYSEGPSAPTPQREDP